MRRACTRAFPAFHPTSTTPTVFSLCACQVRRGKTTPIWATPACSPKISTSWSPVSTVPTRSLPGRPDRRSEWGPKRLPILPHRQYYQQELHTTTPPGAPTPTPTQSSPHWTAQPGYHSDSNLTTYRDGRGLSRPQRWLFKPTLDTNVLCCAIRTSVLFGVLFESYLPACSTLA